MTPEIKSKVKVLVCLIFIIGFIYRFLQANTLIHNVHSIMKSTRIFQNFVSTNNNNMISECGNKSACYSGVDLVGKKCFYLSSMLQGPNNISAIMTELTTFKNNLHFQMTGNKTEHVSMIKDSTMKNLGNTVCNRFITIGAYMGRTGNQIFEIASLIGIAYKYDVIPLIPEDYPLIKYFDLPNLVKPDPNTLSNVVECIANKSSVYYSCLEEMNSGKNVSMYGHLQSWRYFYEARDIIKSVFKIKQNHLLGARNFLTSVSLDGFKRVCIHVRRGDMASIEKQEEGYGIAGLGFIEKAKQFYRYKYSKVQFIVVSDDKEWCRKHVKEAYLSTLTDPGDELALMTLCDDVIVTAGTFGWWGAWLSEGTIVYFNGHPRPGTSLASKINIEDYYPPNWIGLS